SSPDYKYLQQEVGKATAVTNKARSAVLDKVKNDSQYQAWSKSESDARANMEQLRKQGAPQASISDASKEVLRLGTLTSAMERKALDADKDYKEASSTLVEANKAFTGRKSEFERSLLTDQDIVDLKKAKEEADLKVT